MEGLSLKQIGVIATRIFQFLRLRILGIKFIFARKNLSPPVCIVGCGHSGTSLMIALLSMSRNAYIVEGESYFAFSENRKKLIKQFELLTLVNRKKYWVEKTPTHIYQLDTIKGELSSVKIIIMIRDGRDVAYSLRERNPDQDFTACVKRWVDDNSAGESFFRDENVLIVRYEELVEDLTNTMEKVFSFINDRCPDNIESFFLKEKFWYSNRIEKPENVRGTNHNEYRNWQINQPLFDGRGKWRRLSDTENSIIKSIAGEKLIEYGYVEDNQW